MAETQELQAVVQGNALFTKQLYNILAKEKGNVFFSPISAHAVLAMAYQGAKGSTYEAFSKALNLDNSNLAAEGYNGVISQLNNVSDVQLLMANKIYAMEGYSLKQAFRDVTQKKFLSEVESVNFSDSVHASKNINEWVEGKTNKKIRNLIKPNDVNASTRLVLVNAIYFKGNWAIKFNPQRTQNDKFYLNCNDSIDVQMMNNKGKYFYKEDYTLDAKVLELPYSNKDVSLIVVLPNEINGIAELERKLADTDLTKLTDNMIRPEVIVKLPKFKIETTMELNRPLKELGLGVIFTDADFSEMLEKPEPLVVSKVIQKAFVEVNEEGTEAAAATAVYVLNRMRPVLREEPKKFFADHPFIYILAYQKETILFKGRLSEPTNNNCV